MNINSRSNSSSPRIGTIAEREKSNNFPIEQLTKTLDEIIYDKELALPGNFHQLHLHDDSQRSMLVNAILDWPKLDSGGKIAMLQAMGQGFPETLHLTSRAVAVDAFVDFIADPDCSLDRLGLDITSLIDLDFERIARALQNLSSLTDLSLHSFGTKWFGEPVAAILDNNRSLKLFSLTGLPMNTEDGSIVIQALKSNTSLESLIFSYNEIDEACAFLIAESVARNRNLLSLQFVGNRLKDSGVEHICKLLEKSNVQTLEITDGGITQASIRRLLSTPLLVLALGGPEINNEVAKQIAASMASNTSLKTLDLAFCGIGNEGVAALAGMLKTNDSLEELDLSFNKFDNAGFKAIGAILKNNVSLIDLKLHNNHPRLSGFEALRMGVWHNLNLRSLTCEYSMDHNHGKWWNRLPSFYRIQIEQEIEIIDWCIKQNQDAERRFVFTGAFACLLSKQYLPADVVTQIGRFVWRLSRVSGEELADLVDPRPLQTKK
ncbi:hypothetical protein [Variovorax sp. KK3]|uniref:hypothetical protein n=1 Tax=Variovorax sp. KK3 TaxID=1855728 RepID=UPI00117C8942|nr:hypothetical protein [Variovorax sp. KK3]